MKNIKLLTIGCIVLLVGFSCKQNAQTSAKSDVIVPEFNADSAYAYTAAQVALGPRVPNTSAHRAGGDFLAGELRRFGAEVIEQEATLRIYDGQTIQAKNIIASFDLENKNRILLCAHWDSRPFSDEDPDPANHHKPVDGANDGAGASAVLLEIARQIGKHPINTGIDIILFDAEDWGEPRFDRQGRGGWCLGSEYWAKNPHIPNYTAKFGILLDMVSAPNALFYKEYNSMQFAPHIVRKVWETAQALGYGNHFINQLGGSIEDDHIQVVKYRKIPTINIIQFDPNTPHGFGDYWHTVNDNMNAVSKETMQAVGQTVLHVIYNN